MIEFIFDNWKLRLKHQNSQQYDNLSTDLIIRNAPNDWEHWYVLISRKGYLNQIELNVDEEGVLTHTFTAEELAFSGIYSLQLQATIGARRKHTNSATFECGPTLSGDAKWVRIPSVFSDAVREAVEAKQEAINAAAAAEESSKHYPYIDEVTGNWMVWDGETGAYKNTGIHAQGPAGSTYTHKQLRVSDTWYIAHTLNKHPSVTVVDTGDNVVVGDVTYIDDNNIKITFKAPFSGYAYLN